MTCIQEESENGDHYKDTSQNVAPNGLFLVGGNVFQVLGLVGAISLPVPTEVEKTHRPIIGGVLNHPFLALTDTKEGHVQNIAIQGLSTPLVLVIFLLVWHVEREIQEMRKNWRTSRNELAYIMFSI